jgi:hypothetical protein
VSKQHAAGGKHCEARDWDTEEDTTCGSKPCVVHCEGGFTPWSQCTRECGAGGESSRRFLVSQREAGGGEMCAHGHEAQETRPCNSHPCPADCVGEWGRWSECSQSCAVGGVMKRTYAVKSPERNGGRVCPMTDGADDVKPCNEDITCDTDCDGSWTPWGECSLGCHGGLQRRVYGIRTESAGMGARCLHVAGEAETRWAPVQAESSSPIA